MTTETWRRNALALWSDLYRGQRIDVIPIGFNTWRVDVNAREVGYTLSAPAAIRMARKWIDDALWQKFGRRSRPAPQRAAGLPALTVIKGGIDA